VYGEVRTAQRWPGIIERYKEFLPVTESTPSLTLAEGNTPLILSEYLSNLANATVYLKYEGANPTGSFKDRGMVLAVAKAKELGARVVVCASTGNTSASAAAYAARAGMRAVVLIPDGYVALGKLAQAMVYGADIIAIRGNFDDALQRVRDVADPSGMTIVNSINPYRLDGQQSAAFEICDALGSAPDQLYIPVGNAGNISAYWRGFRAYLKAGRISALPQMCGFQAAGAAALVHGQPVSHPETFATAIRIGKPASGTLALEAARESHGGIWAVTDEDIREAYQTIAREGIFAEPGSAASVAGFLQRLRSGAVEKGSTVVCVLTGNGLKDPDTAMSVQPSPARVVDNTQQAVLDAIGGSL